jgi:hypothetical protein
MPSNAKHRPLVTDGALVIDQLHGTISPLNNRNNSNPQVAPIRNAFPPLAGSIYPQELLTPPPEPTSPKVLAQALLRGQTENNTKAALESKSGAQS